MFEEIQGTLVFFLPALVVPSHPLFLLNPSQNREFINSLIETIHKIINNWKIHIIV